MEQLLNALKNDREDIVGFLAADMFILRGGKKNEEAIRDFEKFANCKIVMGNIPSLGIIAGSIQYNNKKYYFG